jgi:uncharacterized cupin superfamily protein
MSAPVFHDDHNPARLEPFAVGQVQWLRRNGDGGNDALAAGIWTVTPEDAPDAFDLPIEEDETVYIVSGHLRIEVIGGDSFDLRAGSMASFSKGAKTRWKIVEPTIEFFVYS